MHSPIFTFCRVIFQIGGRITLAVFAWRRYRDSRVLRILLLLPMLVSEVVVGNICINRIMTKTSDIESAGRSQGCRSLLKWTKGKPT
jgi:ABC-type sugar transport system permease subunit